MLIAIIVSTIFSWVFAAFWLAFAHFIPDFKRNPRKTYIPAMFISTIPQIITIDGLSYSGVIAIALCSILFFWQMTRAQKIQDQETLNKLMTQDQVEELIFIKEQLIAKNYKFKQSGKGWIIIEPLGGRKTCNSYEEFKLFIQSIN